MRAQLKNESRASYNFRNVYFMDEMLDSNEHGHFKDIPPYLHMLQHVFRSFLTTKYCLFYDNEGLGYNNEKHVVCVPFSFVRP